MHCLQEQETRTLRSSTAPSSETENCVKEELLSVEVDPLESYPSSAALPAVSPKRIPVQIVLLSDVARSLVTLPSHTLRIGTSLLGAQHRRSLIQGRIFVRHFSGHNTSPSGNMLLPWLVTTDQRLSVEWFRTPTGPNLSGTFLPTRSIKRVRPLTR